MLIKHEAIKIWRGLEDIKKEFLKSSLCNIKSIILLGFA